MGNLLLLFKRYINTVLTSPIVKMPGIKQFIRLYFNIIDSKTIIQISVQGHKMYVNTADKVIVPQLMKKGVWEEYETNLIRDIVKPGAIMIEIGANIGYFTLICAEILGENGKLYSFEPEPNNFDLLVKNIEINGYKNVVPIKKAVSNKSGFCKLFLNATNRGAHSFIETELSTWKEVPLTVETIALDDFLEMELKDTKVDVIKIDAEGAEGLIVSGASKLLHANDVKIILEFWPHGLRDLGTDPFIFLKKLQKMNFRIQLMDEKDRILRDMDIENIIRLCDEKDRGSSEVNLFLQKINPENIHH